jgi:hypothetical protein
MHHMTDMIGQPIKDIRTMTHFIISTDGIKELELVALELDLIIECDLHTGRDGQGAKISLSEPTVRDFAHCSVVQA